MRRTVAQKSQFGKSPIGGALPFAACIAALGAAADKVTAGVVRLEAAAVDGRQLDAPAQQSGLAGKSHGFVEQSIGRAAGEQSVGRLLQRGEMRHALQVDSRSQFRAVGQQRRQAAIVNPHKLLEHKAGEQLMLRELFRAEAMCILGQRPPARLVRHQQHPPWRFTCGTHPR